MQSFRNAAALREALASGRPLVMGIVNVTPDSFSDGGLFEGPDAAIAHGRRLVEQGAAVLDIGGESTRPGATPVEIEEELRRVMPVIEGLAASGAPICVDTRHVEVMRAALAAGARMINDVTSLRDEGALQLLAATTAHVCLMHMQGEPQTMQNAPRYQDVVGEVEQFLAGRIDVCERAGIARERIVVDPGIGFGKTFEHNVALLRGIDRLRGLGVPVLIGVSRKGMIGRITGRQNPVERDSGSVAAALWAVARGAQIVRVHDVAATCDALKVWRTLEDRQ